MPVPPNTQRASAPKHRRENEKMGETYRDFVIHYVNPPIPIRTMDWGFYHKSYDGEGDNRHGYGSSVEDCKAQIDDWHREQSE